MLNFSLLALLSSHNRLDGLFSRVRSRRSSYGKFHVCRLKKRIVYQKLVRPNRDFQIIPLREYRKPKTFSLPLVFCLKSKNSVIQECSKTVQEETHLLYDAI